MKLNYNKLISASAIISLVGFILSGPVAFLATQLIKPQPEWVSPALFVQNYNPVQNLTFYFGFLLLIGMLMLVSGHYLNYQEEDTRKKFYLLVALGWTIAFCALISFNYICQTTFVHNLALHYRVEYDPVISAFSMTNPMSLCWAIEMWGYALLGMATMFMSLYYSRKNNFIRSLLILNGIVSIAGAIWTIIDISWVKTIAGLSAYVIWNVLMIVVIIRIYYYSKKISA